MKFRQEYETDVHLDFVSCPKVYKRKDGTFYVQIIECSFYDEYEDTFRLIEAKYIGDKDVRPFMDKTVHAHFMDCFYEDKILGLQVKTLCINIEEIKNY